MGYPYILKTGSLKKFLEKVPSVGLPDKITIKYLYALDFKSKNDRAIVKILTFLKFLDESGAPTERYKKYRDRRLSKQILGGAVKEAYKDVFKLLPDAHKQGHKALQNYFSTYTGLGERAVQAIVETFKALCSISDFESNHDITLTAMESYSEDSSLSKVPLHNVDLALSDGRKARIIVPNDIKDDEIEKLKKLLDVLK